MESLYLLLFLPLLGMNIYAFVVCWQKGRQGMFWASIIGLPFGLSFLHYIGACRLGRPESKWAREKYGPEKMARSRARFGDKFDWTPGPPLPPPSAVQ